MERFVSVGCADGSSGCRLKGGSEMKVLRSVVLNRFVACLTLTSLIIVGSSSTVHAAPKDRQTLYRFADGTPVVGAHSSLERTDDGVSSQVRTDAARGEAYTAWFVIFNSPQNCSAGACGPDDLFNADGTFNTAQIGAARIAVVWAKGAGAVANPAGRVKLDGALGVGEVLTGQNQIAIGRNEDGALFPVGVTSVLEDAWAAEIHIVIQTHGQAHSNPSLRNQQLTSFRGACNPQCTDLQFAVHLP